jgi:hypothetical protein
VEDQDHVILEKIVFIAILINGESTSNTLMKPQQKSTKGNKSGIYTRS